MKSNRPFRLTVAFRIPHTRKVRVIYTKPGPMQRPEDPKLTRYAALIDNPQSSDGLQVAMLSRHVAMRQIQRVEPVESFVSMSR